MKLFLSYYNLQFALARKEVSQEDLDTGLFYFACSRSVIFGHEDSMRLRKYIPPIEEQLYQAIEKAEADGRCRWFAPFLVKDKPFYSLLRELLATNGIKVTLIPDNGPNTQDRYCFPRVHDLLTQQTDAVEACY